MIRDKIDLKNKKIVVIYMLYFGDMVSLTPFLEVLRREAEGSEISLVVDSRFVDSVRYNPNVDHIIPADRAHMGMKATWNLGKKIGRQRPDILLVLHGTSRTSLTALAMKPKFWTGEAGTRLDRFFMDRILLVERKDCHAAEKYLRVLRDMGVEHTENHGMQTFVSGEWEKAAAGFFSEYGIHDRSDHLLGLSVSSSMEAKNWPAACFGRSADHFAEKGYRPVFFGVKSELPRIEEALSVMKHRDQAVSAAGRLSMGEFMAAASWCDAGLTNDSGPMYVFDSRGVPTIALFGPSNVKLHHPLGRRSCGLSSSNLPMEQDHVAHTVRDGSYTPIDRIPVEEVIRALEWALGLRESEEYGSHCKFIKA